MTKEIIKRLFIKILLFQVILLLLGVALSSVITTHFKNRLGSQLAAAFRNDLLMGDTRKAMLDLPKTISGDFVGVQWTPTGSSQAFSIPESADFSARLVYNRSIVSLYFDESRTSRCGELAFYYYRWMPALWALVLWSILFITSIPIWLREKRKIEREYALSVRAEIGESLASLAAQVAHDIRSPLVALDAALENTSALPEKQRAIVRHSLNRIRDVANSLLERNRRQQGLSGAGPAGESSEVRLLSSLIDSAVTEKRIQYGSKPGIAIDFKATKESYGLFAAIQPVEFGRLLSNLVNNAAEALGDKGNVDVRLIDTVDGNGILLTIADNGKGIPPEILAKLGKKGETHGKAGGSGLGLFHARTTAESWGGTLNIDSTPAKGTTVTVKLPKAPAPPSFVSALELVPGRPVIVLDDDLGIHSLWQKKFYPVRLGEHNIEVLYFNEPAGLRVWIKGEPDKAKAALYLFDYELSGSNETGLSLAEELGLCSRTILVSGRSEENRIVEACSRLKVRSIPKNMLEFIPVTVGAPAQAVLIDDDTIVHMNWEAAADEAGIELTAFKDPAVFMANLQAFSRKTPIYIDSELGGDTKGEDVAAALKEKGFTNITLATGYAPEQFAHLPWLKVRGKESPWRTS